MSGLVNVAVTQNPFAQTGDFYGGSNNFYAPPPPPKKQGLTTEKMMLIGVAVAVGFVVWKVRK